MKATIILEDVSMRKAILIFFVCLILVACSSKTQNLQELESFESDEMPIQTQSDEVKTSTTDEYVIKYATILTGEHNSSAQVDINDDLSVNLYNFFYDGKAPDVYIALGNFDNNGNFVKGEVVSPLIEGVYKGEDYKFSLSSDINLESYTAISIYCNQYSEDFASAELIDIE